MQAVLDELLQTLFLAEDSEEFMHSCLKRCLSLFRRMKSPGCEEKTRRDAFRFIICRWNCKNCLADGAWSEMLDAAMDMHQGDEELDQLLVALDSLLSDEKAKSARHWTEEKACRMKIALLEKLGRERDAEKVFQDNLHIPAFRRVALEKAFGEKNFDEVLRLAEKNFGNPMISGPKVSEWTTWKFKVYDARQDICEIRRIAGKLFLAGERECLGILRKTYPPARWPKRRAKLIRELSKRLEFERWKQDELAFLFSEEGMWEELLRLSRGFPRLLRKYEDILLRVLPRQFCEALVETIRAEAENAADINAYWRLCHRSLKRLNNLRDAGGEEMSIMLAREFRDKYQHRPAMLLELDKFLAKVAPTALAAVGTGFCTNAK